MTTNVIPLGTASALPARDRHLSAVAVERKGRLLLFDCAEGTQYRLLHADLNRVRVDAVFVTHLHGDHWYGLPGLVETLSLQQRTDPVTLVLPKGGRALLDSILREAPDDLPYPIELIEIKEEFRHAVVYETDELTVEARPLDHEGFAMGFRLEERDRPGRFHPDQARTLGVPEGPTFGQLQAGESVTLEDGTTVQPSHVMGPARPGVSVAYVTDTRPCDGGRALAKNVDLLYHDATFTDEHHARAIETGHSTAREAAEVAREAGAERLLLGHLSARYDDPTPLEREAQSVFSPSCVAEELRIYRLDPREKEPDTESPNVKGRENT